MKIKIDENKVRGLIFDCDGTLVDSMPLHFQSWEFAFDQVNAVFRRDFFLTVSGMKETDVIHLYNKTFNNSLDADEIVRIKHDHFSGHIHKVLPFDKIVDVAAGYLGRLPLAVVSGSPESIVHGELDVLNIRHFFGIILTASDPFTPKPAPDLFLEAARRMNISPENCLVFEDGDSGLIAAERAGMQSIDVREILQETNLR